MINNDQAFDILTAEYTKEYWRVLTDDLNATVEHEQKCEAYRRALATLALVDDKLTDLMVKMIDVPEEIRKEER